MSIAQIVRDVLQKNIDKAKLALENFDKSNKEVCSFTIRVCEYCEDESSVTEYKGTLRDAMLVALNDFRREYGKISDIDFHIIVLLDSGEKISLPDTLWRSEDWYEQLISQFR